MAHWELETIGDSLLLTMTRFLLSTDNVLGVRRCMYSFCTRLLHGSRRTQHAPCKVLGTGSGDSCATYPVGPSPTHHLWQPLGHSRHRPSLWLASTRHEWTASRMVLCLSTIGKDARTLYPVFCALRVRLSALVNTVCCSSDRSHHLSASAWTSSWRPKRQWP